MLELNSWKFPNEVLREVQIMADAMKAEEYFTRDGVFITCRLVY